jgi:hypothetical protein
VNAKLSKKIRKRIKEVVKDYDDTNFLALLLKMTLIRRILFALGIIIKNGKLIRIYENGRIIVGK